MAYIELAIKIDEEKYNWIKENNPKADKNFLVGAIARGTPLPKGHGDLIDRDELYKGAHFVVKGDVHVGDEDYGKQEWDMFLRRDIDAMPPIIEADKESEDKDADSN